MYLPTLAELDAAADIVYRAIPATPQHSWPLLDAELGTSAWVKHENHMRLMFLRGLSQRDCPPLFL